MIAATLLVATVGVGCQGEPEPSADVDPAVAGLPVPTYPPNARGPLDEYLAFIREYAPDDQKQRAKDFAKEQELIAPCMKEQGFEYIPVTWMDDPELDVEPDPSELDWGTLEFAQQFGYGIVDSPWADQPEVRPEDKEPPDPNQPYVDSLSESARQAYQIALQGDSENPNFDEARDGATPDPTIIGCSTWAQDRVGSRQVTTDPEFAQLFELIDEEGFATRNNTPEVVALDKEWSACMAERGHVFANRDEPERYLIESAQKELWSEVGDKEDPDDVHVPQDKLDGFQDKEIQTAVADYECAESINYSNRRTHIFFTVQQAFVDEHREELDALALKYGNKR